MMLCSVPDKIRAPNPSSKPVAGSLICPKSAKVTNGMSTMFSKAQDVNP